MTGLTCPSRRTAPKWSTMASGEESPLRSTMAAKGGAMVCPSSRAVQRKLAVGALHPGAAVDPVDAPGHPATLGGLKRACPMRVVTPGS